jgi:hypothetical protein
MSRATAQQGNGATAQPPTGQPAATSTPLEPPATGATLAMLPTALGVIVWHDGPVGEWDDDPDDGRAPICPYCGVTTLPAELANVLDTEFVCDNADCDAYGEPIGR